MLTVSRPLSRPRRRWSRGSAGLPSLPPSFIYRLITSRVNAAVPRVPAPSRLMGARRHSAAQIAGTPEHRGNEGSRDRKVMEVRAPSPIFH